MFSLLLCKPHHRSYVTRQPKVREPPSCLKFQILLDVIIVLGKYQVNLEEAAGEGQSAQCSGGPSARLSLVKRVV